MSRLLLLGPLSLAALRVSHLLWRRALLPFACALLTLGCRAAAPTNQIAIKNDTASSAHVEYAYAGGLFGGPIGAAMSKYDVPAGQTLQTGATYEATTLAITVGGQTIHLPITPAGPCDEVLVELLAPGGTRVSAVPIPGACPESPPPTS